MVREAKYEGGGSVGGRVTVVANILRVIKWAYLRSRARINVHTWPVLPGGTVPCLGDDDNPGMAGQET